MLRPRSLSLLCLATAIWLVSCATPTTTADKATGTKRRSTQATATPEPTPAAEASDAADDPAASATATPGPTPTPTATATVDPELAVRQTLANKLLAIARVGFLQTQAGLLSDKGGGVVSNNAGNILSNNVAGLISDKGQGYRILAAGDAIEAGPLAGEELGLKYIWADNSAQLAYYNPLTFSQENPELRRVLLNPAGHAILQTSRRVVETWTSSIPKKVVDDSVQAGDDGRFLVALRYESTLDQNAVIQTGRFEPGISRWNDSQTGVQIDIDAVSFSFPEDKASYQYRYPKIGHVEKGTVTKLRRRADNQVRLPLTEMWKLGDLEARYETPEGAPIFTKRVTYDAGSYRFVYDLHSGMELRFDRQEGKNHFGKLLIDGAEAADATLERRTGADTFTITFPDAPAEPLVIGFGSPSDPTEPVAKARWLVSTVAGAATAGTTDGPGADARFAKLAGLVRSRVNPNRLYACDRDAHKIRAIDVAADGSVTVSTYAGTGAAGSADGARLGATFYQPVGLAIGPDDTLYVADTANRRIRRITPDGTVDTYAGTGVAGAADSDRETATFNQPAGLALDGTGNLYVTDLVSHTLRRITADGQVETVAGSAGAAGLQDGAGGEARFNTPYDVEIAANGDLLVADAFNHSLRRVTPGGHVTTVNGSTDPNMAGLDGPASGVCLYSLRAITLGPSGTPYLGGLNVRMLRADGQIGSLAGAHSSAHIDGTHDQSAFTAIGGLAFGRGNVLFVADGTRLRAIKGTNAPQP